MLTDAYLKVYRKCQICHIDKPINQHHFSSVNASI